jgi:hypothetical protein
VGFVDPFSTPTAGRWSPVGMRKSSLRTCPKVRPHPIGAVGGKFGATSDKHQPDLLNFHRIHLCLPWRILSCSAFLLLTSRAQLSRSYRVLLSVDGISGARRRIIAYVLKPEPCRITTTSNEAEVKQREKEDGPYAYGRSVSYF